MSPEARLHRSYLYAPGSRPRLIDKALAAGADAVVLDLEDAVAANEKASARRAVAATLDTLRPGEQVHVRINRTPQGFDADDVRAVVQPALTALRLPKVAQAEHVRALAEQVSACEAEAGMPSGSVELYPTVESARGAVNLAEILQASERIVRPVFGETDYLADIGAAGDDRLASLHVRSTMVLASRAAGLGPPIDSVHTRLDDEAGLREACLHARALGFFGKSVIHPRQLPVVHEVFTPTQDEVRWARQVVQAAQTAEQQGQGAVAVDGEFIDPAVAARARALLAISEAIHEHD